MARAPGDLLVLTDDRREPAGETEPGQGHAEQAGADREDDHRHGHQRWRLVRVAFFGQRLRPWKVMKKSRDM